MPGVLSTLLMLSACSSRQDKAPYESRVAVPGTRSASESRPVKSRAQQDEINWPSSSAEIEQKQPQSRQQNILASDSVESQHKQQRQAEIAGQAEKIKHSVMEKVENSSISHAFPPDAELRWKWPVTGKVVQSYRSADPARRGILIDGVEGEGVTATEAGEVVYSDDGLTGYGQLIIIKHNRSYLSVYAQNQKRLVAEGEWVTRGAQIATMGRSAGKAVLHFEIRHNGDPQDPLKYLP